MNNKKLTILAIIALFASAQCFATRITIVNMDSGGEGFNDPSPAVPVGGNAGVTVGEQRLRVFEYAARIWSSVINSNVDILVESKFDALACTASSAVLGSAGPNSVHRNFSNAPLFNTYYAGALANALSGSDQSTSADITATFNSNIGTAGCLQSSGWYYGLDGNAPTGTIDLLNVIEHEIAHGLGFLTFVDTATGQKFNSRNDAFMLHLEDHSLGQTWDQLTNTQRLASSIDSPDLHWAGSNVTAASGSYTAGLNQGHFRMYAPDPLEGGSSVSHFAKALSPNELMEPSINAGISNTSLTKDLFNDIGWPIFSNFAPVISDIADVATAGAIVFSVDDHDDPLSSLIITVDSSDTSVIDGADFSITGAGKLRTMNYVASATGTSTITVTVSDGADSSSSSFQLTVTNSSPTVFISTPMDNDSYTEADLISFAATASDVEDGDLSAVISWSSDIDGPLGSGATIGTTLSAGSHVISAAVVDGGNLDGVDTISLQIYGDEDIDGLNDLWEITFFGNLSEQGADDFDNDGFLNSDEFNNGTDPTDAAPLVTIDFPGSGYIVAEGASLNLAGSAADVEDGFLSESVTWTSNIDGLLGSGSSIDTSLSNGTHTISATVMDSAGSFPFLPPSIQVYVFSSDGDVDGSGVIDAIDVLLLQQYLIGAVPLDIPSRIRADVYPASQGDGTLTASDLLLLQQQVIGQ